MQNILWSTASNLRHEEILEALRTLEPQIERRLPDGELDRGPWPSLRVERRVRGTRGLLLIDFFPGGKGVGYEEEEWAALVRELGSEPTVTISMHYGVWWPSQELLAEAVASLDRSWKSVIEVDP